jgi:hypothetical protein
MSTRANSMTERCPVAPITAPSCSVICVRCVKFPSVPLDELLHLNGQHADGGAYAVSNGSRMITVVPPAGGQSMAT